MMILRLADGVCDRPETLKSAQSKISELTNGLIFMMAAQSTALYWFLGPVAKPVSRSHMPLLAALMLVALLAIGQESQQSAILRGTVRDDQGKPIAQVGVLLQKKGTSNKLTTQTDAHGQYIFLELPDGIYSLEASKDGYPYARFDSVFLKHLESRTIDLTLGMQSDAASSSSAPQFFDQPQFTVSGVTDTTTLGGHGSDTVVRTRNSLAKETASLSGTAPKVSPDPAADSNNYPAAKSLLKRNSPSTKPPTSTISLRT